MFLNGGAMPNSILLLSFDLNSIIKYQNLFLLRIVNVKLTIGGQELRGIICQNLVYFLGDLLTDNFCFTSYNPPNTLVT